MEPSRPTLWPVYLLVALLSLALAERVMSHGYKLGAQWGPDRRVELAPGGAP